MSIFNSTEVVLRLNKEGNIFTKIKLNKNELYKDYFNLINLNPNISSSFIKKQF